MRVMMCLAVAVFLSAMGCSCDEDGDPAGMNDGGLDGALHDGASDSGNRADGQRPDGDGSVTHGDGAISNPEVCDGIDNDNNGIIDDVDVGGDGVCDCLLIATLGEPGEWGDGDVFAAWLNERSDNGATKLGDATLTEELLEPFQVLVVEDIRGRAYSTDEIAALQEWVERGGGLMTLIGYGDANERVNVNRLLEPSGIQYDNNPILGGNPTVPITEWNAHPVSEGVEQVGVDNGYEVVGEGDVIARQGGYDLLRGRSLEGGKVLVWGDEWITYDSEWTEHPEYQLERFWLNSIKWLTPTTECQVPIRIR